MRLRHLAKVYGYQYSYLTTITTKHTHTHTHVGRSTANSGMRLTYSSHFIPLFINLVFKIEIMLEELLDFLDRFFMIVSRSLDFKIVRIVRWLLTNSGFKIEGMLDGSGEEGNTSTHLKYLLTSVTRNTNDHSPVLLSVHPNQWDPATQNVH